METNFTTQADDPLADILHHRQQHIGTHMGLGIKKDVLPCPGQNHLFQDPGDPGIIQTGIQFTVRESTGTALTKLDIGFWIQFPGFPKVFHRFMPGNCIRPPFQDHRPQTGQSQHQAGKHACRAKADHHRAQFRFCFAPGRLVGKLRGNGRSLAAGSFQDLFFVALYLYIHSVDDTHIRLFPGIDTAADQLQLPHRGIGAF